MRSLQLPRPFQLALAGASAALCVVVAGCYILRPDALTAATIWPPWVWLIPGLALARLAWGSDTKRAVAGSSVVWLLFVLVFCEEPRSLARTPFVDRAAIAASRRAGRGLRVVSLNCAGGNTSAAAEVGAEGPDLVLLQETPGRLEVKKLAGRLYAGGDTWHWGFDTAILSRAPLRPEALPRGTSHFVAATAELPGVGTTEIISLRLTPPVVRFDLWSPACWRDYEQNRRVRREVLREVSEHLAKLPPERPVIAGGDFNAPAGDAIFRLLRPRLHDAFAEGGAGWGNSALNDIPVSRIDQVWVSRHFRGACVRARATRNSDHRMVICDLVLK